MRLVCAGTGTAAPEGDRACSGYWVEAGAARLLLDCGPGVVHSLARLGLPWPALTHLVLTHFHNDHTGDVPFLLFAMHYGVREARHEPLTVIGPAGTGDLIRRLGHAFGQHVSSPAFPLAVLELASADTVELAVGVGLSCQATPHTAASLAYRVEADGLSITFTGDTGESDAVAELARGADVLVAECSLPEKEAIDVHLTPARLARLASAAAPGLLVVTHVYPQLDRSELAETVRRAGWRGRVMIARDGLVLP